MSQSVYYAIFISDFIAVRNVNCKRKENNFLWVDFILCDVQNESSFSLLLLPCRMGHYEDNRLFASEGWI